MEKEVWLLLAWRQSIYMSILLQTCIFSNNLLHKHTNKWICYEHFSKMDKIMLTKTQFNTFFTRLRWYFYISNSIFPPIPPEARTRSSAPRWQLSPSPGTRHAGWNWVGKDWENATHPQSVMMTVMTATMRARDGELVRHELLSCDSVNCIVSVPSL